MDHRVGAIFKPAQFRTAANFCNDLAKGLLLATILGQGNLTTLETSQRVIISLGWVIFSLLSFVVAVSLSRYE